MVAIGLVTGSAYAGPVDVHGEDLRRGADAQLLYSDGQKLHTRASGVIALPETEGPTDRLRLLGKTAAGWVVWRTQLDHDPSAFRNTLYSVAPDGTASVIYTSVIPWEEFNDLDQRYGLSKNGHRTVEWLMDEGSGPLIVRNLAGDVVGKTCCATRVVDFSGPRLTYLMDDRAFVWKPGTKPHLVTTRTASFAELQHDVIFLKTADGRSGPTRLSKPGSLRWKAPFEAVRLSPDGARVIGRKPCHVRRCVGRPVFQVRRMSDGALLGSFRAGNPREDMSWEGNRAVLFPVRRPSDDKVAVARCTIAAKCNRASGWMSTDGGLSFPYALTY
jgi:hypothetical protein